MTLWFRKKVEANRAARAKMLAQAIMNCADVYAQRARAVSVFPKDHEWLPMDEVRHELETAVAKLQTFASK
jgi:hypothetical protein